MLSTLTPPLSALLVLADGTVFEGTSIGVNRHCVGELVFNTAMTGYQEILTDPSYHRQIVTLTYPHIGNTGVNDDDSESNKATLAGLVIKDLPNIHSNFRANMPLQDHLKKHAVSAISNIDTRQLTRILRKKGSQMSCIFHRPNTKESTYQAHIHQAMELIKATPELTGQDLAKEQTTSSTYTWTEKTWAPNYSRNKNTLKAGLHVVVYDFGIKKNILRMLADEHCQITVVPANTTIEDVLQHDPDGILFSNGPGDPEPCDYAIATIQSLLKTDIPLFGICLGHQFMGLAAGASTEKMKFGHHGANHPIQNLDTGTVMITSQNHGYSIAKNTLPEEVSVSHISLFDGTIQGLRWKNRPAFSLQGHPEASPGPHDMKSAFSDFVSSMINYQSKRSQCQKDRT